MSRNNKILLFAYLFLLVMIWLLGINYKNQQSENLTNSHFQNISEDLTNQLSTLIKEKQNANLALAISLSKNYGYDYFKNISSSTHDELKTLSLTLRNQTDFKNVWIQFVDHKGVSQARSWSKKTGTNLTLFRPELIDYLSHPSIETSIEVTPFDLSFNARIPIFDSEQKFIGFLEIITHFNSVAKKIANTGYKTVFLVTPEYTSRIAAPFTKLFADQRYIANKNADAELIALINQRKAASLIPENLFTADENSQLFIVNQPLYNNDQHLADLLMIKALGEVYPSGLNSHRYNITLGLVITSLILGFVFYLLAIKKDTEALVNLKEFSRNLVLVFIVLATGIYFLINWRFEVKTQTWLEEYTQKNTNDFKVVYHQLNQVAKIKFDALVNKPEVQTLLAKAYEGEGAKKQARQTLYRYFEKDYHYFKDNHHIRQFHFHLKNNESFLRFHRPQKFGDNLSDVRQTVAWVNNNQLPLSGFEEGRIFNGFRNVFPIFLNNNKLISDHLGSVEISFPADALSKAYLQTYQAKSTFLVKSDTIDRKVFSEEKQNYIDSPIKNYRYDLLTKKQLSQHRLHANLNLIEKELIDTISKNPSQDFSFTVHSKDQKKLFTFIPFSNPINHENVAYFILEKEHNYLIETAQWKWFFILAAWTVLLLALLYIYKEVFAKSQLTKLLKQSQSLLDSQDSIVLITNGYSVYKSNQAFLNFFGVQSIEAFKQDYGIFYSLFFDAPDLFHRDAHSNNENWIQAIQALPINQRIIGLCDKDQVLHYFAVKINRFDQRYIVNLNDISSTYKEHLAVIDDSLHDALTHAFNRKYFYDVLPNIVEKHIKNTNEKIAIAFFDIDHFKQINDTYGHDVGDQILIQLVKLVHENIRKEDILIRWGGEEFILFMPIGKEVNVLEVIEHLREKISQHTFEKALNVTCSFGLTTYSDSEKIITAVKRADAALYSAKADGRNNVKPVGM